MCRPLAAATLTLAALALGACGSSSKPVSTAARSVATGSSAACAKVAQPAAKGPQQLQQPTLRLDPAKRYTARLQTSCGEIDISLDVRHAPKTTASYVYLAQKHFFDGLTFHRVARAPDGTPFVIQGGDPLGTGAGGPGYQVVERPPASLRYTHGVVAMAKTQSDPAGASGSQFFIVTGTDAGLPPDYALLGNVSGGLSNAVVSSIAGVPTDASERPLVPVVIGSVTITTG
jgi:cyclophilin family peptidyl-prolyl cis-trans isomerase